ncbi:trimeric LpxA-like protein [Aspergillus karnatakaensis]|uniref:dynactin subunit 5 n=1 Tax=Aspergillus karnatakaensis TaxID=1810916 RepID=UPI003CCD4061
MPPPPPTPQKPTEPNPLTRKQDTGNIVSRRSQIHGTQHIALAGKSVIMADAVIRGDLFRNTTPSSADPTQTQASSSKPDAEGASTTTGTSSSTKQSQQANSNIAISIGRYTFISRAAILRPPSRLRNNIHTYSTLHIGSYVFIGERSVVEAARVEDYVTIGKDVVIGSLAILKERCQILDGAVVPPGMVVPSHCVVGGQPGRVVGEVGIAYAVEGVEGGLARERYRSVLRT